MSSDEYRFLRARAVEERSQALAATDPDIGRAHAHLARQYESAAAKVCVKQQLDDSREAIRRSLALLKSTGPAILD